MRCFIYPTVGKIAAIILTNPGKSQAGSVYGVYGQTLVFSSNLTNDSPRYLPTSVVQEPSRAEGAKKQSQPDSDAFYMNGEQLNYSLSGVKD